MTHPNARETGEGHSVRHGTFDGRQLPRRWFLRSVAAAGAVAGVTGLTAAQLDPDDPIELGGQSDGWIGRAPEAIEDERNPTLELEEGESYELTWENLDGVAHNFVIIDADGTHLLETDLVSEEGETQTVEFTADAAMSEYYCAPHPQTMRGEITTDEPVDEVDPDEPERYFPEGPTVGANPVAEGLVAPTDFADPPGTEYMLVTDQTGQIYSIDEDGRADDPWLDIEDRMVAVAEDFYGDDYADPDQDYDERGLVGIEFHPEFEDNGRFYLSYSAPPVEEMPDTWSHVQVVSEFQLAEDGETPDPDSERRVIEFYKPQYNHNAGPMAFGPDGYLYLPMGDGGGADDRLDGHVDDWYDENEGGNGQDTTRNLFGGVLRLDVDSDPTEHPARGSLIHLDLDEEDASPEDGEGYAIPDDNPFAEGEELEGEGLAEYYAWGLRNPFGITFSDDDRLIVADPGQVLYEPAYQIEKGGNYGWNVREGSHCFSTETPATPPDDCPLETPSDVRGGEPLIDPVIEYPQVYQGEPVGIVIIGGHTYEADAIGELTGTYIFGDWTDDQGRMQPRGRVFAATPEDVPLVSEDRGEHGSRPREDLWEMEEVRFGGSDDGNLHHFVRQFGRDQDGAVYVLANRAGVPAGDTGVVFELVPEGEGVEIEEPDVDEADDEEPENDVADDEDADEEPENDVADDEDDAEAEDDVADDEDGAEADDSDY